MPFSDKEKLLEDLLRDANYEEFRKEVHELSLAEFRAAHRPARWIWHAALAASIVVLGMVLAYSSRTKPRSDDAGKSRVTNTQKLKAPISEDGRRLFKSNGPPDRAANAFQNDRLPIFTFIETKVLQPIEVVRTMADLNLIVDTPRQSLHGVEFVRSDPGTVDRVTDAQFLALFPYDTIGFWKMADGKKMVVIAGAPMNLDPQGTLNMHQSVP